MISRAVLWRRIGADSCFTSKLNGLWGFKLAGVASTKSPVCRARIGAGVLRSAAERNYSPSPFTRLASRLVTQKSGGDQERQAHLNQQAERIVESRTISGATKRKSPELGTAQGLVMRRMQGDAL